MLHSDPYNRIKSLEEDSRLGFAARPNRYGDFILYTQDKATIRILSEMADLQQLQEKSHKAFILHYPRHLPLDPVLGIPGLVPVTRCLNKANEPRGKLLATFKGTVPERVHLGVWGSFPTAVLTEPLRCYRCQRFGHHQARCTADIKCGVCRGSHATEGCLKKFREKLPTSPCCPNCGKKHHAWSLHCKIRLELLKGDKGGSTAPASSPPAATSSASASKEDQNAFCTKEEKEEEEKEVKEIHSSPRRNGNRAFSCYSPCA